jgi:hypothetical protein
MSRRFLSHALLVPALAVTAGLAGAQITHLESSMNGANEVPPVVTGATGRADYTVNTFSHVLKYNVSFQNLSSAEILAHIHTANTSVLFPLPLGTPVTGSLASTAAQEAALLTGTTYTNIHSSMHTGGEIRGTDVLAPAVGTNFCFGDGTIAPCPCGNSGAAGHGCENSATTGGALLNASGHTSPDNVVLIATNEKPSALSIFLQGNLLISPTVYGDGLRCAGGQLKRLGNKNATGGAVAYPEGAELPITTRSAALGDTIAPGSTRWYQVYYRDPDPVFCPVPAGSTFNISNGVEILWM